MTDPCHTAKIVANMMHDNSIYIDSEGFDSTTLLKMFVCVEEVGQSNEEFMVELYDCLRILAQENPDFESAITEAEIMHSEDIWGIQPN